MGRAASASAPSAKNVVTHIGIGNGDCQCVETGIKDFIQVISRYIYPQALTSVRLQSIRAFVFAYVMLLSNRVLHSLLGMHQPIVGIGRKQCGQ